MLLRQLEYILAVEKFQSFSKAADYCNITQPTLSQQIRSLEKYLGVELFDRSSLPVTPTKKGRALLSYAREILSKSKAMESHAKDLAKLSLDTRSLNSPRL